MSCRFFDRSEVEPCSLQNAAPVRAQLSPGLREDLSAHRPQPRPPAPGHGGLVGPWELHSGQAVILTLNRSRKVLLAAPCGWWEARPAATVEWDTTQSSMRLRPSHPALFSGDTFFGPRLETAAVPWAPSRSYVVDSSSPAAGADMRTMDSRNSDLEISRVLACQGCRNEPQTEWPKQQTFPVSQF